jgi:hypothetical protein
VIQTSPFRRLYTEGNPRYPGSLFFGPVVVYGKALGNDWGQDQQRNALRPNPVSRPEKPDHPAMPAIPATHRCMTTGTANRGHRQHGIGDSYLRFLRLQFFAFYFSSSP